MKTHAFMITLLIALTAAMPAVAHDRFPFPDGGTVTVMSWNVSNGVDAELAVVPTAVGVPDLLQKIARVYQAYFTRNFPDRAAAIV